MVMSPLGFGTKNHFAAEEQEFSVGSECQPMIACGTASSGREQLVETARQSTDGNEVTTGAVGSNLS
jgi:hypothetical protein